jgi:hypothetical protein
MPFKMLLHLLVLIDAMSLAQPGIVELAAVRKAHEGDSSPYDGESLPFSIHNLHEDRHMNLSTRYAGTSGGTATPGSDE